MKKKLKYIIPIVMVFGLCAYIFSRPKNIVIKYDLPIATSYHDLIEKSDIVVKGRFIGFNHEWNMARDKDNNPSDVFETIGKVDNFEITDIYKGIVKEKSIIEVNQRYSERIYYTNNDRMFDTSEINADTRRITALDQLYIEPDLTKEYILFLNYEKDYNNYYGSTQPFMVWYDDFPVGSVNN